MPDFRHIPNIPHKPFPKARIGPPESPLTRLVVTVESMLWNEGAELPHHRIDRRASTEWCGPKRLLARKRVPVKLDFRTMSHIRPTISLLATIGALSTLLTAGGCHTTSRNEAPSQARAASPTTHPMPRELCKAVLPTYTIEPPDILTIDAIHVVPKAPYYLRTLDALRIQVLGTLPDAPIDGIYTVEPGGMVDLGLHYGQVAVAGMTVDGARVAIENRLREPLKEPVVSVTLAEMAANQQIAGPHLVGPDGTVTLGSYGSVPVVGHTIAGAKMVIEQYLSQFLDRPEVSVDVYAYNSKVYYIITEGAGLGDGVYRFPVTGNETVLDAVSQINGLQQVSSKRIWIARPTPQPGNVQVLPVNWDEITAQASTGTNYQILPGDRLFISEDKLIALDTNLAKFLAPLERIMGITLLGTSTATRLSGPVLRGGGNPRGVN